MARLGPLQAERRRLSRPGRTTGILFLSLFVMRANGCANTRPMTGSASIQSHKQDRIVHRYALRNDGNHSIAMPFLDHPRIWELIAGQRPQFFRELPRTVNPRFSSFA